MGILAGLIFELFNKSLSRVWAYDKVVSWNLSISISLYVIIKQNWLYPDVFKNNFLRLSL